MTSNALDTYMKDNILLSYTLCGSQFLKSYLRKIENVKINKWFLIIIRTLKKKVSIDLKFQKLKKIIFSTKIKEN